MFNQNFKTMRTIKTILGVVVAVIILAISAEEMRNISLKELFHRNNVLHNYEMISPVANKTN